MIIVPGVRKMSVQDNKTARPGSVYLILSVMVVAYVIPAKVWVNQDLHPCSYEGPKCTRCSQQQSMMNFN